jgi:Beta-carotene isomerase D27-like, C-terminal
MKACPCSIFITIAFLALAFERCSSYHLRLPSKRISHHSYFSGLASTLTPFDSTDNYIKSEVDENTSPALLPIYPAQSTRSKDAIWEKMAIFLLSWSLACVSVDKYDAMKYVYPGMGYPQFVSVSRTLLRGTAEDINKRIVNVLLSVIPLKLRISITEYCLLKPRWIAEKSSEFMSFGLLGWLVGPVERTIIQITQPDGSVEDWLSGVKLTECRYLVESGCKSACLNLCKGPTQTFFNNELGIKLHMKPDFSNCSCEMNFGIAPPPAVEDPAYGEPCFLTCSMNELKKKPKNKSADPSTQFNKCS